MLDFWLNSSAWEGVANIFFCQVFLIKYALFFWRNGHFAWILMLYYFFVKKAHHFYGRFLSLWQKIPTLILRKSFSYFHVSIFTIDTSIKLSFCLFGFLTWIKIFRFKILLNFNFFTIRCVHIFKFIYKSGQFRSWFLKLLNLKSLRSLSRFISMLSLDFYLLFFSF